MLSRRAGLACPSGTAIVVFAGATTSRGSEMLRTVSFEAIPISFFGWESCLRALTHPSSPLGMSASFGGASNFRRMLCTSPLVALTTARFCGPPIDSSSPTEPQVVGFCEILKTSCFTFIAVILKTILHVVRMKNAYASERAYIV
jgi:hypothetical protein